MKRVGVVITNRVHYARSRQLLKELQTHPAIELKIIVAGSALLPKYGNVEGLMAEDGFTPSSRITMLIEGGTPIAMAKTTGLGLLEISNVFHELKLDLVLLRGDRYEVLASAIAAAYLNIPIAHIEGGDVSGTIDESVRHAITKLSHMHFATNSDSAQRIIKMGEDPEFVFDVGSCEVEYLKSIDLGFPYELWDGNPSGIGNKLDLTDKYLVVLQHPVTTEYGSGRKQMEATLAAIEELKLPTILMWPNMDAGNDEVTKAIRQYWDINQPTFLHLFRNLPPERFLRLLNHATCLIGNSSAGIKECSYLGTPVINIGSRQNGRLKAENVIDVPYNSSDIVHAARTHLNNGGKYKASDIYYKENTSKKIAEIIATKTPKIQKKIMY